MNAATAAFPRAELIPGNRLAEIMLASFEADGSLLLGNSSIRRRPL
jgi:hypothetical protein